MDRLRFLVCIAFAAQIVLQVHADDSFINKPMQIEDKIEDLPASLTKPISKSDNVESTTRSNILDNIFNIPIQTLRAVSELVQSIAGNLQSAGSATYFRRNEPTIKPAKKELEDTEQTVN